MSDALEASVLVLNKNYTAVHVIGVRRAFRLLAKEHAEVLLQDNDRWNTYNFESWIQLSQSRHLFTDDGDWIHTVSLAIRVPRIIRLLIFDRLPSKVVKFNRRNIFARDDNRCQYCGHRFPTTELSLDHVVPRSQGGLSSWTNIVCACTRCNARKGGRLPREASMSLIRKPLRPKSSPILQLRTANPKYQSWKHFLDDAYWSVPLKD